jgi:hypothetical protein
VFLRKFGQHFPYGSFVLSSLLEPKNKGKQRKQIFALSLSLSLSLNIMGDDKGEGRGKRVVNNQLLAPILGSQLTNTFRIPSHFFFTLGVFSLKLGAFRK